MKFHEPPAGKIEILRIIADYLDTDPELTDEYLYRFAARWGEENFSKLVRFVNYNDLDGNPWIIRTTLEHDFQYDGDNPKDLMTILLNEGQEKEEP
jgi:predicted patatin/cPLA2 family phospholipase